MTSGFWITILLKVASKMLSTGTKIIGRGTKLTTRKQYIYISERERERERERGPVMKYKLLLKFISN